MRMSPLPSTSIWPCPSPPCGGIPWGVPSLVPRERLGPRPGRMAPITTRERVKCPTSATSSSSAQAQPATAAPEVVLAHGTTRSDNEWPEVHWLAVAQKLIAAGFSVGLPHAGERELARVKALAGQLGPMACVWPAQSLDALARRMAASAGVIGVDSGLSHLAVALDLPHVQIFSQDRAWRAGPLGRDYQRVAGGAQAPDVAQVWDAWQAALAASHRGLLHP